jgi:IS30 family transposase
MIDTHLSRDERYQIAILAKANFNHSEIAKMMARDKSSISLELRPNRGLQGYRPKQANEKARERRLACANSPRVADSTWAVVEEKLAETWSPEQISSYLKARCQPGVSYERIYQYIYADKRSDGSLHKTLRCQKTRKKRSSGRERRGTIFH